MLSPSRVPPWTRSVQSVPPGTVHLTEGVPRGVWGDAAGERDSRLKGRGRPGGGPIRRRRAGAGAVCAGSAACATGEVASATIPSAGSGRVGGLSPGRRLIGGRSRRCGLWPFASRRRDSWSATAAARAGCVVLGWPAVARGGRRALAGAEGAGAARGASAPPAPPPDGW